MPGQNCPRLPLLRQSVAAGRDLHRHPDRSHHRGLLRILEEMGLEIRSRRPAHVFRKTARSSTTRPRSCGSAPTSSATFAAMAPERFVLHARNPERDLHVGGDVVNFGPVNGAPNISDREGGRRYGDIAAFRDILKITHSARHPALAGRRRGRAGRPAGADAPSRHVSGPYRAVGPRLGRARRRRGRGRGRARALRPRARHRRSRSSARGRA